MSDLLKGNFETKGKIQDEAESGDLEDRFEREAMKRLGGSIAFVKKKQVVWDLDEDDKS